MLLKKQQERERSSTLTSAADASSGNGGGRGRSQSEANSWGAGLEASRTDFGYREKWTVRFMKKLGMKKNVRPRLSCQLAHTTEIGRGQEIEDTDSD